MSIVKLDDYRNTSESASANETADPFSTGSLAGLFGSTLINPEQEEHLKGIIEGAVIEAWSSAKLRDSIVPDDPFDAIYIAQLTPDTNYQNAIQRINKHRNIVDLSNNLQFDDGWDD